MANGDQPDTPEPQGAGTQQPVQVQPTIEQRLQHYWKLRRHLQDEVSRALLEHLREELQIARNVKKLATEVYGLKNFPSGLSLSQTYSPPADSLSNLSQYENIASNRYEDVMVQQSALPYLRAYLDKAKQEGYDLEIRSGFRSYKDQAALHEERPDYAAPAGNSQHQTGLAVDLVCYKDGKLIAIPQELIELAPQYGITHPLPGDPPHFVVLDALYQGATQDLINHGHNPHDSNAVLNTFFENLYDEGGISNPQELSENKARSTSFVVAQRTPHHIKDKGRITRDVLSGAIEKSLDEFSESDPFFHAFLPPGEKRKVLAAKVAETIGTEIPENELALASQEAEEASKQALSELDQRSISLKQLTQRLEHAGLSSAQAEKVANRSLDNLTLTSLSYKAELSPRIIENIIRFNAEKIVGKKFLEKNPNLTSNLGKDLKETLSKLSRGIGLNSGSTEILKRGFKIARKNVERLQKLDKALGVAGKVFHPIKTATKAVVKKVGNAALKAIWNLLLKYAPKLALRLAEIGEAATGVGIALVIAQEILAYGIDKLIGIPLKILKDYKNAIKTGFQDPLKGGIQLATTTIDATMAAGGAGVGGVVGAVGLGLIGALVGSVIPVAGTAVGAIVGAIVGAVGGAGYGAKKGYEFRKKMIRKLIIGTVLKAWLKDILAHPLKFVGNIIKGWAGIVGQKALGFIKAVGGKAINFAKNVIGNAVNFGKQVIGNAIKIVKLPFQVGGAIGRAGLSLVKTGLSNIATGVKSLFNNVFGTGEGLKSMSNVSFVKEGSKMLAKETLVGEGTQAQLIRGTQNIVRGVPSQVAKIYNWSTSNLDKMVSRLDSIVQNLSSEVLTADAPAWLTRFPYISIMLIFIISLITYTIILAAYHVPSTAVDPFYEDPSKYLTIIKRACIQTITTGQDLGCNTNWSGANSLPNPEFGYIINYEIELRSANTDQVLHIRGAEDVYNAYGLNNPTPPSPVTWGDQGTLAPGEVIILPAPPTVTINPGDNDWYDSILTNVVTVTFDVVGGQSGITSTGALSIVFGNPPFCPPTLSPTVDPYICGWKYGTIHTGSVCIAPDGHQGVDIHSNVGNLAVYSSFPCQAEVVYVGSNGNGFGDYVALKSGPWYAFYAHFVSGSALVTVGETITGPVQIGTEDSTGNSTGNHVHYEIRDETLGTVLIERGCQPSLTVNPCSFGDWGIGGPTDCAY